MISMLQVKIILLTVVSLPIIRMKPLDVRKSYNPGVCAKSNHGKLILVKDRENKDTVLVCTQDEGLYTWKTTEGSKPPGEYFNPAFDCLEILNQNTKAKDGYYWVDFHGSAPHKVWCDMTTDGGGYMLVGRMNDSVTWDIPSSNNTVEPLGSPQWSSAFGDVPILDFRIQIGTDGQYRHVNAHWSFRFKNKRPLKKLMMVNEGGCPYDFPGIGDISFVKNLMIEEIVSKDFPCSVFGAYTHPSAKTGWTMMNSCLEKPCSHGFAYHHMFPVQLDYSGGFGFRTGNNTGSSDGTTAFFGCDKGKCCACYGPPGESGVFCGKECQPKNGGIITKNVNAWFWVRLNPPQKVWEKCMEYRTEEENGDAAWYKLVGDRNIPVKGRCGKNEAFLNDGIVVVPDDVTADKVPHIAGLLAYQKDSEVLRLRKNGTWKVIAEEEMVLKINETLAVLELMISRVHFDFPSSILFGMPDYVNQLKKWLPSHESLVLCYRASEDSWDSSRFHAGCDYKGPTVTIIRVKSYIFGGYTDISWGGSSGYRKKSSKSFIFSLRNKDNLEPFKADIYRYSQYEIYTASNYGPTFGGGHDIYIVNGAGGSTSSYTNFGYTYRPPSASYGYGSSSARPLLAGSYLFTPSELEVFYFV